MADMVDNFSDNITGKQKTAAPADLFAIGKDIKLDRTRAEEFHTVVAKGLFLCKRARPDIQPAIPVLCSRVKEPNESDWKKLLHLLEFLHATHGDELTIGADNLHVIKWYIDAAFAVHPDFKSHTGGCATLGHGAAIPISQKQRINTTSSTTAELVGTHDASTPILWTKLFLEAQGYPVKKNILYQDNKSAILLETNGKKSSSKQTHALNIRYFFLTDQVKQGNVTVEYCPTGEMWGDYFTKPLQGALFEKFRREIMGFDKPKKVCLASASHRSVLDRQTDAQTRRRHSLLLY